MWLLMNIDLDGTQKKFQIRQCYRHFFLLEEQLDFGLSNEIIISLIIYLIHGIYWDDPSIFLLPLFEHFYTLEF